MKGFENKEAEEFKSHIKLFEEQDEKFQGLKPEIERGMYKFVTGNLIEKIKHCAANRLLELRNLMPELLFKKADDYYNKLDILNLAIRPPIKKDVDDFIVFKKKVEELNDTVENYKPPLEFINALKMIISDYNIKLPSHYNSKVIEANAQLSKLRKQIEERMNQLDS